jgi:hypothetical protein
LAAFARVTPGAGLLRVLTATLVVLALLVGSADRGGRGRPDPDLSAARAFALLIGGAQDICGSPLAPDTRGADCLACVLAAASLPAPALGAALSQRPCLPAFPFPARQRAAGGDAPPCPPARGPPGTALDLA